MKEKDFKAIITSFDEYSKIKKNNDLYLEDLFKQLNDEDIFFAFKYADWSLFQTYDDLNIALFVNLQSTKPIDNRYLNRFLVNALENKIITLGVDNLTRLTSSISFNSHEKMVVLNFVPFEEVINLQNEINELSNSFSLLLNTFKIIKYLINQEQIKAIDPVIIFKLYQATLNELTDNKYYAYLEILIKALDEMINNKKYMINYLGKDALLTDLISEANYSEYKKLRKALANSVRVEEDDLKFDSAKEIIIDVNPIKQDDIYMWHYELVGRNIENSGGEYQDNLPDFQTAILKGVFKGLKKVTEMPSLINKKITLKCDYSGILTDVMLTNDENKSRMKTIKQLIETNNLKVTTTI